MSASDRGHAAEQALQTDGAFAGHGGQLFGVGVWLTSTVSTATWAIGTMSTWPSADRWWLTLAGDSPTGGDELVRQGERSGRHRARPGRRRSRSPGAKRDDQGEPVGAGDERAGDTGCLLDQMVEHEMHRTCDLVGHITGIGTVRAHLETILTSFPGSERCRLAVALDAGVHRFRGPPRRAGRGPERPTAGGARTGSRRGGSSRSVGTAASSSRRPPPDLVDELGSQTIPADRRAGLEPVDADEMDPVLLAVVAGPHRDHVLAVPDVRPELEVGESELLVELAAETASAVSPSSRPPPGSAQIDAVGNSNRTSSTSIVGVEQQRTSGLSETERHVSRSVSRGDRR